MKQENNGKNPHDSSNPRKKRLVKPGFLLGLITLAVLLGFNITPWFQDESTLYAAVPALKLETTDGFYEIGKTKGRVIVLFFSFPG